IRLPKVLVFQCFSHAVSLLNTSRETSKMFGASGPPANGADEEGVSLPITGVDLISSASAGQNKQATIWDSVGKELR
ncbi:Hypothetical predicted protein, partial [Podarcis lilfordi]